MTDKTEYEIKTKYGTAQIDSNGYYLINTTKEGYKNKRLHRLVYEDYHKVTLLENTVIHHKDGDKTNNCILNLEAMTAYDHKSLHATGRIFTEEHILNLSKSSNSTGYFRVVKNKDKNCNQGFRWGYRWRENGKRLKLSSVDLDKLKEKVIARGLPWIELSK